MLVLRAVLSERACLVYVVQTLAGGPLARQPYADAWLAATGPLGEDEAAAAAVLRRHFATRAAAEGCRALRRLIAPDQPGAGSNDAALERAVGVLLPPRGPHT